MVPRTYSSIRRYSAVCPDKRAIRLNESDSVLSLVGHGACIVLTMTVHLITIQRCFNLARVLDKMSIEIHVARRYTSRVDYHRRKSYYSYYSCLDLGDRDLKCRCNVRQRKQFVCFLCTGCLDLNVRARVQIELVKQNKKIFPTIL